MLIAGLKQKRFPSRQKLRRFRGRDKCFGFGSETFRLDGVDNGPSIKKAERWEEERRLESFTGIFIGVCRVRAVMLITSFFGVFLLLKAWERCLESAIRNVQSQEFFC